MFMASKRTTGAKRKRKTYHHGDLRQAMIEGALKLVAEHGPDGVSVREAARRAGVSPGAPFRHFADKSELMAAVASDGMQRLLASMMQATTEAGDDPADRLRAMGVAFVRFAVAHPSHFRVMHVPELSMGALRDAARSSRAQMKSLVEEGQRQGTLVDCDPEIATLASYALVYGVARMFVDGLFSAQGVRDSRAEAVTTAIVDLFGRGLRKPG
jgi:AcrR family transcriptional regulator